MKKYEAVISTRVPKMLADEMSHVSIVYFKIA